MVRPHFILIFAEDGEGLVLQYAAAGQPSRPSRENRRGDNSDQKRKPLKIEFRFEQFAQQEMRRNRRQDPSDQAGRRSHRQQLHRLDPPELGPRRPQRPEKHRFPDVR